MRPAYALLLIGSLACGGAGLPPKDAPTVVSAATPTSSDWLQVQMPSAAVAFSVPGKDAKDLREFSDFASFLAYAYSTERIPDDKIKFHPKYAKFGVLKHGGLTYMLQMMSVSDDDLFMLISVHKRSMGKYEKRSKIEVNGYPGLQAERTKEGGAIDVWRSWTAADRFYAMTVEGIPEGPDGIENARRFIESVRMLDRP